MGDYWRNAVRHPEDIGVGHIRRTVDFSEFVTTAQADTGQPANSAPIGTLEAGAVILRAYAVVQTAFNGTTPALTVGSSATVAGVMASADIVPGTITTGIKAAPVAGALLGTPLAADTVFYVFKTTTDTTAGKATFIIEFVNKRESIVRPFPNN